MCARPYKSNPVGRNQTILSLPKDGRFRQLPSSFLPLLSFPPLSVIPEQSGIHAHKSLQNICLFELEVTPKLFSGRFFGMRVDMGIRLRGCDGKRRM